MNIVHDHDLAVVAWIRKYFLVAGHSCIKTDFTRSCSDLSKGFTIMYSTIS